MSRTSRYRVVPIAVVALVILGGCGDDFGKKYGYTPPTSSASPSASSTPAPSATLLTPDAVEATRSTAETQYLEALGRETASFEEWLASQRIDVGQLNQAARRAQVTVYYCQRDATVELEEFLYAEFGLQKEFGISKDGQRIETQYSGLNGTVAIALTKAKACK